MRILGTLVGKGGGNRRTWNWREKGWRQQHQKKRGEGEIQVERRLSSRELNKWRNEVSTQLL